MVDPAEFSLARAVVVVTARIQGNVTAEFDRGMGNGGEGAGAWK